MLYNRQVRKDLVPDTNPPPPHLRSQEVAEAGGEPHTKTPTLAKVKRYRRKRWHGFEQLVVLTVLTLSMVGLGIMFRGTQNKHLYLSSRIERSRNNLLEASRYIGLRSLLEFTTTDVPFDVTLIPEDDNGTETNSTQPTEVIKKKDPLFPKDLFTDDQLAKGCIIFHCLGMIYMFVALALVCDEFFVPALDVIIEKAQISEDVAGATFMAAGGSAPELFTSVIGVFISFDDVGIGTIVGSAVFNILFVIAMCVLFSKTVLELTWWPLFRDVTFYSFALLMLVVCFVDGKVFWYEAAFMFLIYLSYCCFMKWNSQLERFVKKNLNRNKVTRVCSTDQLVPNHQNAAQTLHGSAGSAGGAGGLAPGNPPGRRPSAPVLHSGTKFRHGLLQLMIHTIDPLHDGEFANGKVDEKATQLHAIASLKVLLDATKPQNGRVETYRTPDGLTPEAAAAAGVARPDAQSHVSGRSSHTTEVTHVDSLASSDGQGSQAQLPQTNGDLQSECNSTVNNGDPDDDEDEVKPIDLSWPDTWKKRINYIIVFPLIMPMWLTMPDTRTPRGKRFFFITFLGSIIWIAIFSYLMVWWATVVGTTIQMPPEVMGLTMLAAGTSVPDLITSVIVARKGFGDMAVSSSVGSNLFDVTCGLPIPWLLFALSQVVRKLINGSPNPWVPDPILVSSDGMACSVLLLFTMLMFVLFSIACSKWKMNKQLGFCMFLLYFVFVVVSLMFTYDKIPCPF
ncbi:unnamed protein product, partial [Meganyctiphanes norvegica]